jgi:hypothetical protein
VRHTEVLQGVKEEKNIPCTLKRKKANWIGHMLRRNFCREHVTCVEIARSTEVMKMRTKI